MIYRPFENLDDEKSNLICYKTIFIRPTEDFIETCNFWRKPHDHLMTMIQFLSKN